MTQKKDEKPNKDPAPNWVEELPKKPTLQELHEVMQKHKLKISRWEFPPTSRDKKPDTLK